MLSDPTRRQIIETLSLEEQAFGVIADRFEMSRPAVSQHLKALREAGLVNVRADAQRRIYSLNDKGLQDAETWLNRVRTRWNNRLDALEQLLREEEMNK